MQLRQYSQELRKPAVLLPKSLLQITTIQIPMFTTNNHSHIPPVRILSTFVTVNMCCYEFLSNYKVFHTHMP